MSSTYVHMAALTAILACAVQLNKIRTKKKRLWVRSNLARRDSRGVYHNVVQELRLEDHEAFFDFHGLTKAQYQELLQEVMPLISKKDTRMRKSVSPGERLSVTLRYLATGESRRSLAAQFRISHNLISDIIPSVCRAICQVLQPTYLKVPNTVEEWQKVAYQFYTRWNFPMCLGAIDGRRVLISKPPNSGSEYDSKSQNSIIMLALVDADYKFTYLSAGSCGRASDAGIWDRCFLREGLERNLLNVPPPAALPFSLTEYPYTVVGGDAFPLKTYMMKPFSDRDLTADRRIFNYRLSRARRISENAFGILSAKFRIFKQPICTSPQNVQDIIFCTVVLHNYQKTTSRGVSIPQEMVDWEDVDNTTIRPGRWRELPHDGLQRIPAIGRDHSNEAKKVRDALKNHFMNEGQVPWQEAMVRFFKHSKVCNRPDLQPFQVDPVT